MSVMMWLNRTEIAVYDKWLQVYPNASWDDVIKALETAEEITIAKQLRERYSRSTTCEVEKMTNQYSVTPSGHQSQPEEVTVSEDIVSELDTLQRSFVGLTGDVKVGVERHLENGTELKLLARDLQEERAFHIPSLRSVTTSDELFEAIHPHYNFLNCYLIVSIALHLSGAIAEKATEYKERIISFMKTTKLRFLQNTLKQYVKMLRAHSNTTVVEIVVENGWGDQNIWLVKMLIKFLFPVKHPDELPWYDIVPGSVVMTFIALEHMTPSLIESSRKQTEFMRLIGVISLKIGHEVVWTRTSHVQVKFGSFEDNLIQATLTNNFEVVKFLLQYTQVNVNAINTTNALIKVFDEELFWGQLTVKRSVELDHRSFTALLKDVKYEFEIVQRKKSVCIVSNSSAPVADGNSKFTHRPCYNFLNGRVLVDLSDQLPEHLSTRVKQYLATMNGITKRKSLLIHLRSSLKRYFPTPFPDSIEVILSLHSVWRACSVWYVEQLGQLIFTPTLFHKLQWFRVDDNEESLRVVLLAEKELIDSLTKESFDNESQSSLLGVISAWVDDIVVISNDYSDGYTFNEACELAKATKNEEVSDLLVQILQLPIDFIRFRKFDSNNNYQFLPEPDSTPLMIACCNNNSQLVQLLLDHNADPNILNRKKYTALMHSTGNSKIFQMLLDHGADIKACSFLNETVLYFACWVGNVKVVKTILATICDLVNVAANNGHTPLSIASHFGNHVEIVQMLLQVKADANVQSTEGWTALAFASHYGHSEIVQILLQAKANVHIQTTESWTALAFACRYGHMEIVRILLQEKADLNIQNSDGWTPLISASYYGHTEIVKMLLQAKAYLNKQCNSGWTALFSSNRKGHTVIVQLLLQAKADPNIQESTQGWTALHLASFEGRTEIVEMLLQANADPNIESHKGWTALHLATHNGFTDIVRMLLRAGADPSMKNSQSTALDLALKHGHTDISEELCSVLFK